MITRSTSFRSLKLSVSYNELPLCESDSSPSLELLLEEDGASTEEAEREEVAPAATPKRKRTYLHLSVSPPARWIAFVLFLLNYLPIASAASAFISLKSLTAGSAIASFKQSVVGRVMANPIVSSAPATTSSTAASSTSHVVPPPSSFSSSSSDNDGDVPSGFFRNRPFFGVTLPAPGSTNAAELARTVQEAATTELAKLRVQLKPLEVPSTEPLLGEPLLGEAPTPIVAAAGLAASAFQVLREDALGGATASKPPKAAGRPRAPQQPLQQPEWLAEQGVLTSRRVILGLALDTAEDEKAAAVAASAHCADAAVVAAEETDEEAVMTAAAARTMFMGVETDGMGMPCVSPSRVAAAASPSATAASPTESATAATAEDPAGTEVEASASALPSGFDLNLSLRLAQLCGFAYHSCDPPAKDGTPTHIPRLKADLRGMRLRLEREVNDKRLDIYALIARNDDEIFISFRGSCNLKHLGLDLNYLPANQQTMEAYAAETGMRLPKQLKVHGGFLDAWRSVRAEVIDAIDVIVKQEQARAGPPRPLRLYVSGHSMGGAIAMLASLELAIRLHKMAWHPFSGHTTYTFAAPRLGNAPFARLYNRICKDHWALQRSSDAIPHLPFAAWGYQHPHGVAYMQMPEGDEGTAPQPRPLSDIEPEAAPESIGRSGDRGDDKLKLRPFGGKMTSWVSYHHIFAYLEPLQDLCSATDECELPFELEGFAA